MVKEKAKIARIAAEAIEKAEDEARVRVKSNAFQRAAVEAVTNTRSIEEAKRRKRDKA